MSGDVQPRKRKDKKKKREDESSHGVHNTKMGSEDVHFHVQHEHGTGGHWCAKIFFFSLLAILFGLVGLIILENRGISDLDTPLSESRFSNYFDGWVDESRQEHDDHDPVQASIEEHEEHDEPFEEEEDHSELDEEPDEEHDEDDDEHKADDEDATAEQTNEEEDEDDGDDGERDEGNDNGDEDDEEDATKEATVEQSNEAEDNDDDDDNDVGNDNNNAKADDGDDGDDDEDDKDENVTQEATKEEDDDDDDEVADDNEVSQEANDNDDDDDNEAEENDSNANAADDDDDDDNSMEAITERSTQQTSQRSTGNSAADDDNDDDAFDEEDDDDDTNDSVEHVVDNDAEELLLLQQKARQQAAEAAKNAPTSAERDDKDDSAEAVPSWVSSQIKPKEELGGGPQAQNDDFDPLEYDLRRANEHIRHGDYQLAIKSFDELVLRYPDRPQVFLAQATLFDQLSEKQQSQRLLIYAVEAYKRYLALGDIVTNHAQFRAAAERCIDRLRFMGQHIQAVPIHQQLIARFANVPDVWNKLAITYMIMNRLADAKLVLQEVLRRWPNNGAAQVHYGFVLRHLDNDYESAVTYLRKGIASRQPSTQDARFYFNLGDSLQRLGRKEEAMQVYRRGVALKLFVSVYQRSLYNEPNLRAKPYWTKAETTYAEYLDELEDNWRAIRREALSLLGKSGNYRDETEGLRDTGNWQQFELYSRGQRSLHNCRKAPTTCGLIEKFTAATSCRRGQVKFSIMQPNTHIYSHCGPTNCRLRAHLGLVVPEGARLRVAEEVRTWKEGEFLIFDDSFEHEVWHTGTSVRLVLIVDVWHPDLSEHQRQTLSPI